MVSLDQQDQTPAQKIEDYPTKYTPLQKNHFNAIPQHEFQEENKRVFHGDLHVYSRLTGMREPFLKQGLASDSDPTPSGSLILGVAFS